MAGFSPPLQERDRSVPGYPPVLEIAEEKRSKRNPRQLDFECAMDDFRVMFPTLEVELIESVLRANGGAVDDTIDQLLAIAVDSGQSTGVSSSPPLRPPKPASGMKSSTERLPTAADDTPVLPPREGSLKRTKAKTGSSSAPILYNTPRTRYDTEWSGMLIPMLGKLPSGFLRIIPSDLPPPRPPKSVSSKHQSHSMKNKLPTHLAEGSITKSRSAPLHHNNREPRRSASLTHKSRQGHITTATGDRLSSNVLKRQIEANQRRLQESCDSNELEGDTERFLEDERLALIMQNEEFLRELKRNEDFMRTLEFERDILATRLAHEQKKNRQLSQLSPALERGPPNWMVPRPSECDENSLPRSISPSSDTPVLPTSPSQEPAEELSPSIVPIDRTDRTDVHDFRDQLKSMGASSKKKFALLAKKFFSTSRKKRKGTAKIVRNAHGPSTLNLLEDNDDEDLVDLTDSLSGSHINGTEEVLFEPLPNAWISEETERDELGGASEERKEHFL
ncbi:CUE domain-containing protein 1-like isoform X2 [Watersipora subatra]|uniref:CUE domain-containing protein 1-like isoform X2 n=1 Tax=Watersipora subatra TaxID=2589382 RepID=UPI00355C2E64